MKKGIFVAFNILILIGIVGLSYFFFALRPLSASAQVKRIEIRSGEGFEEIISRLKDAGLIRSMGATKVYAVVFGLAHRLKPGKYAIDSDLGTPYVLKILAEGPSDLVAVIKEGMSFKDIEKTLVANGVLIPGAWAKLDFSALKKDFEFLQLANGLEGYLFPDTYKFLPESDPMAVARKILDNFQRRAWPLIRECRASGAGCHGLTANEVLILASIIEKEIPDSEERRIAAGVLLKRLDMGMALQTDATLIYIKCEKSFFFCDKPAVERKDLLLSSSYNTYRYRGLPPGPISNPGSDAIRAVLNPRMEGYLYYLSDPKTKKTIFSKTLEEHNENRAKYLGL